MKRLSLFLTAGFLFAGCEQPPAGLERATPKTSATSSSPAYSIQVTNLGTLGGSGSGAFAINNAGQVVGGSDTPSGEWHAFLWTKQAGMIDLGTLGGNYSDAYGINNRGQVVGESETASGETHAFVWTKQDGLVDLGTLGGNYSSASAINDRGQVLGSTVKEDGTWVQFLWTQSHGMGELSNPPGFSVFAMNNRGWFAGQGFPGRAMVWTPQDGAIDIGSGFATAMNDRGQVVGRGFSPPIAFRWTPGKGLEDLGNLGHPDIAAYAINNHGDVAGFGLSAIDERAFLWTESYGMIDLGTLGGSSSYGWGMNDRGQVVGEASTTDEAFAVIWELVPASR